jgi:hypothetical protein
MVRLGHKERTKALFVVVDVFVFGVQDIFLSDALTSFVIDEDADHPLKFGNEGHDVRGGLGDLDVRAEGFEVPGG